MPSHSGSGAAKYFLPSENEWYKAAYYKSGGTNAGYWYYPTQSNTAPSNVLSATGTNNANYEEYTTQYTDTNPPYLLTPVGTFSASPGPYGTYDMGGDIDQWDEQSFPKNGASYGQRGGDWASQQADQMSSYYRFSNPPTDRNKLFGFRVASSIVTVPEPNSFGLLVAGALALLLSRRLLRVHTSACGGSMKATTFISPPQWGQAKGSASASGTKV